MKIDVVTRAVYCMTMVLIVLCGTMRLLYPDAAESSSTGDVVSEAKGSVSFVPPLPIIVEVTSLGTTLRNSLDDITVPSHHISPRTLRHCARLLTAGGCFETVLPACCVRSCFSGSGLGGARWGGGMRSAWGCTGIPSMQYSSRWRGRHGE